MAQPDSASCNVLLRAMKTRTEAFMFSLSPSTFQSSQFCLDKASSKAAITSNLSSESSGLWTGTQRLWKRVSCPSLKGNRINGSGSVRHCNTALTHHSVILCAATTAPSRNLICTELHSATWTHPDTSQLPWESAGTPAWNSAFLTCPLSAIQAPPSFKSWTTTSRIHL